MLEEAIQTTRREPYAHVQYARFPDDMVIVIDSHPQHAWLPRVLEKRPREEFVKLKVEINEEKRKIVDLVTKSRTSQSWWCSDFRSWTVCLD